MSTKEVEMLAKDKQGNTVPFEGVISAIDKLFKATHVTEWEASLTFDFEFKVPGTDTGVSIEIAFSVKGKVKEE